MTKTSKNCKSAWSPGCQAGKSSSSLPRFFYLWSRKATQAAKFVLLLLSQTFQGGGKLQWAGTKAGVKDGVTFSWRLIGYPSHVCVWSWHYKISWFGTVNICNYFLEKSAFKTVRSIYQALVWKNSCPPLWATLEQTSQPFLYVVCYFMLNEKHSCSTAITGKILRKGKGKSVSSIGKASHLSFPTLVITNVLVEICRNLQFWN